MGDVIYGQPYSFKFRFFGKITKVVEFRFLRSYFSTLVYQLIYHIFFTAELGDYEEGTHTAAFVSEFRFIPHQDEKFELDVLDQYKKLRYDYLLLLLFEKKCVEFA